MLPADEIPDFDIVLEAEVSIDRIPEDKLYSIFSIFSPFSPPPPYSLRFISSAVPVVAISPRGAMGFHKSGRGNL